MNSSAYHQPKLLSLARLSTKGEEDRLLLIGLSAARAAPLGTPRQAGLISSSASQGSAAALA